MAGQYDDTVFLPDGKGIGNDQGDGAFFAVFKKLPADQFKFKISVQWFPFFMKFRFSVYGYERNDIQIYRFQ